MAKTYTPIGWEDATVSKEAYITIDDVDYEVTPAEISGTTPLSAENLNHMDLAIKDLYDNGATSNDIVISPEQPTGDDWKLWINSDEVEQLSEIVDNLNGNQTTLAPSVRAVKEALSYSTEEHFTGKYWIDGKPIYSITIIGYFTKINQWESHGSIPNFNALTDIKLLYNYDNRTSFAPNDVVIEVGASSNGIETYVIAQALTNNRFWSTIEYTKTTDEATINLLSEVDE